MTKLNELKEKYGVISDVRGLGLLIAIEFNQDIAEDVMYACLERGLMINLIKPNTLRVIPPLIITRADVDEGLGVLDAGIVRNEKVNQEFNMADKVVLAYSGGVDTSVAIKWVPEHYKMDVITLTVDIGNVPDLEAIRQKAEKLGVKKAIVIDAKEEFVKDYCWPALQADAIYEGAYPLATALGRPLIAKLLAETALENGATAVSHGCTGKGNDQVRFDVGINTLAPDLKIIAPAREWGMTREQTIEYALKNKIPIPVTKKSPYSIDENLWGRAVECGILEDPWNEPPEDALSVDQISGEDSG